MKKIMFITFLTVILAACAPAQIATGDIQNTAIAMVQTAVVLTQAALPTATLPPSTFTPTATIVYPTPSPLPTQPPIIIITPDAIQVENWRKYETTLTQSLLPKIPPESVLCEWIILGRSGQDVYVVAVCGDSRSSATAPAVIYLDTDGSIQNVEVVEYGSSRDFNIQRLFPAEVQEMIYGKSMQMIYEQLVEHLNWRLLHREEPPLIVLSATPMP